MSQKGRCLQDISQLEPYVKFYDEDVNVTWSTRLVVTIQITHMYYQTIHGIVFVEHRDSVWRIEFAVRPNSQRKAPPLCTQKVRI